MMDMVEPGAIGAVPAQNIRKSSILWRDVRKNWTSYLFILPNLIGVLVFLAFPVLFAFYMSFTEWDVLTSPKFIGIANYTKLFTDDNLFWTSLWNSTYYVLLTVPASILAGLGLAVAMNQAIRGIAFFRAALYVPVLASAVAVAAVWRWILNSEYGVLNAILEKLHLPSTIGWLTDPHYAMISLAMMGVWKSAGYYAVILFAALQGVPKTLLEAAELDGAGPWRRFINITVPMIAPAILFVAVVAVIGSFQVFDQVFFIDRNGGPGTSTYVYNLHLYNNAFSFFRMGYASAMAYILFAILFVITYLQLRVGRERASGAYDYE